METGFGESMRGFFICVANRKQRGQGSRLPCGRILPAGGFIRYPRVRIRMEKSIAVSVYGGFSRDGLPETGRNGCTVHRNRYRFVGEKYLNGTGSTATTIVDGRFDTAYPFKSFASRSFIYAGKKRAGRKISACREKGSGVRFARLAGYPVFSLPFRRHE